MPAAIMPSDARDIVPTIDKILAQFEGNEIVPILHKTAAAWSESDIVALEHYEDWCNCVNDDQERSYMRNLVQERNRIMAKRFAALHADGHKVFVAVGALHMVGPDGLPSLLRAMGFEVQRVVPAE